jgi:hypothetical protein
MGRHEELLKSFEILKTFKPEHTSVTINGVTANSSEVEVEILNEDPDFNGPDEYASVVETFDFDADISVEDVGIGAYEFWGFKGVDSHLQYEVNSLKLTDEWPEELKWLAEIIEEQIYDSITELRVHDTRDFY